MINNDEIDENEYFQQDFTTASEWEVFNARLEEIFNDWKLSYSEISETLSKNQIKSSDWKISVDNINFGDLDLCITRYETVYQKIDRENLSDFKNSKEKRPFLCPAFIDIISTENDYCVSDIKNPQSVHEISRWYGLRDFVTITPIRTTISNENQIRVLMSSIHIAISESNCIIPVFVQVLDEMQKVFLGVCEYQSTRLSFEVVHLHNTPSTCKYLTGLLDMFKGKVCVKYINPVTVTVRMSYSLIKFLKSSSDRNIKYAFSDDLLEDNTVIENALPFGVSLDPIKEILLYCTWPEIQENVVVDSSAYTDFNPLLAPVWSILTQFEESPVCYMFDCLMEYLQSSESNIALTEYFTQFSYNQNTAITPLDLLTESKIPIVSTVLPNMTSTKNNLNKIEGPLNNDQLRHMLYYMFPDAQPNSANNYKNMEIVNVIILFI